MGELKDLTRFRHMLESSELICTLIQGKTRDQLDVDILLANTIVRQLEVLGEAAVGVSEKSKHRFPNFPWKKMISMRNQLIHVYFDVDYDIVWITITKHLPLLIDQIKSAISDLENKNQ
jgi:uncharacterized protein with HEPN domain